jgi:ubiquinone/menaquinone biosynthesis C-methylase UbiE
LALFPLVVFVLSGSARRNVLLPCAQPEHKIFVVGCGNSRLSPQLYGSGFQNIVNVDISEVVIHQMRQRYKELDRMEWLRMDAMKLEFPDNTFDLVIDKGTVDSLLCGGNSFHNVYAMNKSVSRVMKRGARYVVVTYGQPDTRIDHYRRKKLHFEVEHRTIDKPVFSSDASPTSNYHVYVMTKTEEGKMDDNEDDDDEEDDDFYDKFQANVAN